MNEYEIASLAAREAALWVAVAQVAATLAIGIGQIAVVWYGIRAMQRMGATRAREQDQRHEEAMTKADQRHEEAMTKADQHHGEAMTKADQRHEEAMQRLDDQRRALEALIAGMETMIERTAPGARA